MYVTHIKNIIFIYIIFYLRSIKSYDVKSKEEVLKLKNHYNSEYYCKDDICVLLNDDLYNNFFIEIPDINGNVTNYIVYTCTYDDIEMNKCIDDEYIYGIQYSLNCNNNSECLSNKCDKKHCIFNDENPIVHCDDIYSNDLFADKDSYMHCGKPKRDVCKRDNECSSLHCINNRCNSRSGGPSDSDSTRFFLEKLIIAGIILLIFIIIIIIITCVICCYLRKHKN